jgi:hypothetical protein
MPIDTLTDGLDHPGAVTVRDHPRERHRRTEPSASLLRVTGIHSRVRDPNAHLASTRLGRWDLTNLEHLTRKTLPLVPGRTHRCMMPALRSFCECIGVARCH